MNYVCTYLFLRIKDSHEFRKINPSQTLMNLQYAGCYMVMQGRVCVCVRVFRKHFKSRHGLKSTKLPFEKQCLFLCLCSDMDVSLLHVPYWQSLPVLYLRLIVDLEDVLENGTQPRFGLRIVQHCRADIQIGFRVYAVFTLPSACLGSIICGRDDVCLNYCFCLVYVIKGHHVFDVDI